MNRQFRGLLTILGGFIIHVINGSILCWGYLNAYLISYLKITSPALMLDEGFFLLPIAIFATTFTLSLGGYMESHFGPRLTLCFGCSLIIMGNAGVYLFKDIYWCYLGMFLCGMGIGVNYLVPVRTAWLYFQKHKGKVTGVILCGYGVSASFINFLGEAIINPRAEKPVSGYFSLEVANNMPKFLEILMIAFAVLSVLGIGITFPYQKEIEEEKSHILLQDQVYEEALEMRSTSSNLKAKQTAQHITISIIFKEQEDQETLWNAICSKKFLAVFFMSFFASFSIMIVVNTFRSFVGSRQDIQTLKFTAVCYAIGNGFSRPVWGILYDKFKFKRLFLGLNLLQLVITASLYHCVEEAPVFSFLVILSGCLNGGLFSIMPSFVSKVFGIKLSTEIYGVNYFAYGISGLIGPVFMHTINHSSLGEGNTVPFLILYSLAALFSFLAMIIALFTKEESYSYVTSSSNDKLIKI